MRLLPKDSKARGWILDRASEADLARMAVVGLRVVSPEVAGGVQGQPLFSRRPELGSQIQGSRLVLPAETAVQKKRRQLQDEAIRWKVVQKAVVDQGGVVNEENNAKAIERYQEYSGNVVVR